MFHVLRFSHLFSKYDESLPLSSQCWDCTKKNSFKINSGTQSIRCSFVTWMSSFHTLFFYYRNVFFFWRPKPLNYKGKDVENVFYLRTPEDANNIARLVNNKNAVIVGTSFIGKCLGCGLFTGSSWGLCNKIKMRIKLLSRLHSIWYWAFCFSLAAIFYLLHTGMEVAAALTDKAHSVSVIGIESVPFRKVLGEKVGKAIMKVPKILIKSTAPSSTQFRLPKKN